MTGVSVTDSLGLAPRSSGSPEVSLQALIEVVGGDIRAQGVLPVSLGLLNRTEVEA